VTPDDDARALRVGVQPLGDGDSDDVSAHALVVAARRAVWARHVLAVHGARRRLRAGERARTASVCKTLPVHVRRTGARHDAGGATLLLQVERDAAAHGIETSRAASQLHALLSGVTIESRAALQSDLHAYWAHVVPRVAAVEVHVVGHALQAWRRDVISACAWAAINDTAAQVAARGSADWRRCGRRSQSGFATRAQLARHRVRRTSWQMRRPTCARRSRRSEVRLG